MTSKDSRRNVDEANRELDEANGRKAKESAASKLDPAMPPQGAGLAVEADPALNRKSETEEALKRATDGREDKDKRSGDR